MPTVSQLRLGIVVYRMSLVFRETVLRCLMKRAAMELTLPIGLGRSISLHCLRRGRRSRWSARLCDEVKVALRTFGGGEARRVMVGG